MLLQETANLNKKTSPDSDSVENPVTASPDPTGIASIEIPATDDYCTGVKECETPESEPVKTSVSDVTVKKNLLNESLCCKLEKKKKPTEIPCHEPDGQYP